VVETLKNGDIFIINLDETEENYEEIFYPDIREFYDPEGLTPQMWSRNEMERKGVKNRIIGEE